MRDALDAWQTFDRVWRSIFMSLWRLPSLVAGCLLFYTVLSAFWLHYLPIHIPGHFAAQTGYCLLHAICFTPLVIAVMTLVLDGDIDRDAIWSRMALSAALLLFAYDEIGFLTDELVHAARLGPLVELSIMQYHQGHKILALILFSGPKWISQIVFFMLSVRLILSLPMLTGNVQLGKVLPQAWSAMRGQYRFALYVSVLSASPFLAADYFIMEQYRHLSVPTYFLVSLPLHQWEALLLRAADLTLQFLLYASLAAWLYRAVNARKITAP